MKGAMRFLKKVQLNARFIRPFEILSRVGEVTYTLALPLSMSTMHLIFHVSILWKYVPHESHALYLDSVEFGPDFILRRSLYPFLIGRSESLGPKILPQ
ncbi:hypothetical protein MTR67_034767 [Solanum verrucosum]|uniref:Tf2-1-like SH3-like domain-containing protein n=1 Tax=Solanum verrucosum TaxID=315347 RepID=A0AAF0U8R2_SOLVR|nr:hypothetical protein MTR67_034767 [Solanum verrucosum]